MKILISVLISIFLSAPSFAATLTAGCTPVVAQGGTTPQIQCASIYDTGNTNATGDVGIAQVVPGYTLDINGTIGNSNGDIASVGFKQYTGTTVLGWSGSPTASVYTRKLGKSVFVSFGITGTSNANYAELTVPYANNSSQQFSAPDSSGEDNGSYLSTAGLVYMSTSSSTVNIYKDASPAGTGWTSTGTKSVQGSFTYQSN